MKVDFFAKKISELGIETITGIPDSTLRLFCEYIEDEGKDIFRYNITTENEGGAVGVAVGEYLATGRPACVYMQNSGLGNIVNPITSLANVEVYGIPMLLIIGWRGELGTKDEPQHKFMGRITEDLLKVLDISYRIVDSATTGAELDTMLQDAVESLKQNKQYALLIRKGTFEKEAEKIYCNNNTLLRENVIHRIAKWLIKDDMVVSTTGKISRELYEQCNIQTGCHDQIFMAVGGMGHANMIAYQLAQRHMDKKVICLDGDGALLMHMGSMAVIGAGGLKNYIHICLNNKAHESVGGMQTGAVEISYSELAQRSGYDKVCHITNEKELELALLTLRDWAGAVFLEIEVAIGSRDNLGRPDETAEENKFNFMKYHGVF